MRTCYLKDTLQRDPDLAAFTFSYAPPNLLHDYPEVNIAFINCSACYFTHEWLSYSESMPENASPKEFLLMHWDVSSE